MVLVLVFGVFLVLIGVTAGGLTGITSSHLRSATLNGSVSRDATLVELWVNDNLASGDLAPGGPGAERATQLGSALAALTARDEILRVEVRAPDGTILAASDPRLVGERAQPSTPMRRAVVDAAPGAILSDATQDGVGPALPATSVLREYLPILDGAGAVRAVMVVWRDAAPLLASIAAAERDVLIVVLAAAAVLAAVLFLIFRAAHVRIGRQQDQLVEATRRDPVTGMLNHGAIVSRLAGVIDEARAGGTVVAIAMIDLDNFTVPQPGPRPRCRRPGALPARRVPRGRG